MFRLGQLMIDRIRDLWSRGLALTGAAAGPPPVGLRKEEAAVLVPRYAREVRRDLIRQGLILGPSTKKKLSAKNPAGPLKRLDQQDAHIRAFRAAERARAAARKREWEKRIVNNYKIRSPRFGRTAIHGTERPRSRFYVPRPENPPLYGSGLMKDSLYCIYVPQRSYTDPKTGRQIEVQSGFQFVVQKNRHTASYRAGLTPTGVQSVLRSISDSDLNNAVKHYVSWDGTAAHKLFLAAVDTAGRTAGLVEGIAGFIL